MMNKQLSKTDWKWVQDKHGEWDWQQAVVDKTFEWDDSVAKSLVTSTTTLDTHKGLAQTLYETACKSFDMEPEQWGKSAPRDYWQAVALSARAFIKKENDLVSSKSTNKKSFF